MFALLCTVLIFNIREDKLILTELPTEPLEAWGPARLKLGFIFRGIMLKKPLEYIDQIKQLKNHGMIILDDDKAKDVLSQINYYRFTGYALQFRKGPNVSDYCTGTTFDNILNLYHFDEELRNILRKYIEIAEVYYRTIISYEFAMSKCVDDPHDQHYDENSYFNKNGFNEIKEHFEKEKNYYKDSLIMKHHDKKYNGQMPLWVMVEMMSMSDVSKLYGCMYISEQKQISSVVKTKTGELRNHLHCLSVLRNKCAHAARLYNTTFLPSAELSKNFLTNNKNVKNNTLFAYLIVLVKRLPKEEMRQQLVKDLEMIVSKYKLSINLQDMGFPNNWSKLLWNQTH